MGPESYRHRYDGEIRLSKEWYLDDFEVDSVIEMINNGELTKDRSTALAYELASKLTAMTQRFGGNFNSEQKAQYDKINDTVNKIRKAFNDTNLAKSEAHHHYTSEDDLAN